MHLFILLASVIFWLILFETGLRVFYPTPFGFVQGGVVADNNLCYVLSKNFSSVIKTFDGQYSSIFSTTEYGSRTTGNINLNKQTILMIGDSFTLGVQVDDNQTFSSQTYANLMKSGQTFNVLNFGVLGYNPYQYLIMINKTIINFNTKYVVVNFYVTNDFVTLADDPRTNDCQITVINGYLTTKNWKNTSLFFKTRAYLHTHTSTYNFLSNLVMNMPLTRKLLYILGISINKPEEPETLLFTQNDKGEEMYQTTFKTLNEINKLVKANNATLIIDIIPPAYHTTQSLWSTFWQKYGNNTIKPDVRMPYQRMTAYARENNITLINMYDIIVNNSNPTQYFGIRDNHYVAKGHEKHAEVLSSMIRKINEK